MSVRPFDRGSASDAATVQHADALPALRGGHLQFNSSAITIQVTHPPIYSFLLSRLPILRIVFSGKVGNFVGTPGSATRNFQDESEGIRIREIKRKSQKQVNVKSCDFSDLCTPRSNDFQTFTAQY